MVLGGPIGGVCAPARRGASTAAPTAAPTLRSIVRRDIALLSGSYASCAIATSLTTSFERNERSDSRGNRSRRPGSRQRVSAPSTRRRKAETSSGARRRASASPPMRGRARPAHPRGRRSRPATRARFVRPCVRFLSHCSGRDRRSREVDHEQAEGQAQTSGGEAGDAQAHPDQARRHEAAAGEERPRTKRAAPARGKPRSRPKKRTAATRRSREGAEDRGSTVGLLRDLIEHHETGPRATAGDLDADWQRAESSGEEAVGGSVSTPDQDVVDEIGHALGVEQPSQAPAAADRGDPRGPRSTLLGARAAGQPEGEQAPGALSASPRSRAVPPRRLYCSAATHAL